MKLVIVESPAKSRTIKRFLGKDYDVQFSLGHIRDLPKSELGIDLEHDFEPTYVIPPKAAKVVRNLKKALPKADKVILACDEDREGEAIAWHVIQALGLGKSGPKLKTEKRRVERIVFHEITPAAVKKALANPRAINQHLVDAQQARRLLDRLVGYKLSPLLWKKIARGLSAGRVQSPALRLVVEREEERTAFKKQEYWTLTGFFEHPQGAITALLTHQQGRRMDKFALDSADKARRAAQTAQTMTYDVAGQTVKEQKKSPAPPFITASLQQFASARLGFSPRRTMRIAQQLYEGVDLAGRGRVGLITYMRTDSFTLAQSALDQIAQYIRQAYGEKYPSLTHYKTRGKHSQEAHEAIRPTDVSLAPAAVKASLKPEQLKLYTLIWQRTVASQMSPALYAVTKITLASEKNKFLFTASGIQRRFDGYTRVWPVFSKEQSLPVVKPGDRVQLKTLKPEQHFTQPPPRFSEATLIKALKDYGIGRPSTYAPIISTITERGYVERDENRKLKPTDLGRAIVKLLREHFFDIVDYSFTAKMEASLDTIAAGKMSWRPLIRSFYGPFARRLREKETVIDRKSLTETPTDLTCPECGAPVVKKLGRFGPFLSCSRFPECKHRQSIVKSSGVQCPACGKAELIERRSRRGKLFYGCQGYPACQFAVWDKPTNERCPACTGLITLTKRGFKKCSNKNCPGRGMMEGSKIKDQNSKR